MHHYIKPLIKLAYVALILILIAIHANAQNDLPLSTAQTPLTQPSGSFIHPKKTASELFVRPFITDDARVVGDQLAQLETWVRFDKESGQHWILGAYGPNSHLEITTGGVYGYQIDHNSKSNFSYALPLIQAKILFKEYKPNKSPGVGMVGVHFYRQVTVSLNRPATERLATLLYRNHLERVINYYYMAMLVATICI